MNIFKYIALPGFRTKMCQNKTLKVIWYLFSNFWYIKGKYTTTLRLGDRVFTLNCRGLVQLWVKSLFNPYVFKQELRLVQRWQQA